MTIKEVSLYWDHQTALNERDEARAESEELRAALEAIRQTLNDYDKDRMWAFALRRVRRITERALSESQTT